MTIVNASLSDQTIELDLDCNELEQVISNALDHFDFGDHIDSCLESHDMDQHVNNALESRNYDEYQATVDGSERKLGVLRTNQAHITTALGSIRDALVTAIDSIQPLDRHKKRAQRIQGLVLKMNESDAQSCLEYCDAERQQLTTPWLRTATAVRGQAWRNYEH